MTGAPGDRSAVFLDLDKTVLAKSSTLAFGRPFYAGGLINRRAMLKGAYAQFVYTLGGADETQMGRMRDHLARQVTGWQVHQVRQIVDEALHHLITPLVYAEAAALIDEHRAAGREIVIVSSGGEEIVAPIGRLLGADRVIGTRMVVRDGRYTGEVDFYAFGEGKARAVRELAAARGYRLADCYAYTDSATDLPMLGLVGHPVAVNPDRALRRVATERGWPVLEFGRPVSLTDRLPALPAPRPVLAAVLATGAAGVGLAWYTSRSRGRRARPPRSHPPQRHRIRFGGFPNRPARRRT